MKFFWVSLFSDLEASVHRFTLDRDEVVLVIVDIQEKLAAVMSEKQKVIDNCLHLIELSKLQGIPVIVTEQYPKGLGPSVGEIKNSLDDYRPVEKITFGCCDEPSFLERIAATRRSKVVLTGMETHVCVLQTCIGLMKGGYIVHPVDDAICSRKKQNFSTALEYMRQAGAVITCTETVLFQLLFKAGTEEFKSIAKRIK